jgi:signal transduction histidine kinase
MVRRHILSPSVRNQLLLVYGCSAAIGLQAGLIRFFFSGRPADVSTSVLAGPVLGTVVLVLWWWVFPRLPARSERARTLWESIAALLLISLITPVLTEVLARAVYGVSILPPFRGEDRTVTLPAQFLRYAPLAIAFLPVVPTAIMAVIGYQRSWSPMLALETRAQELHELAASAQLAALRAQIHPHFLFNSLNSIAQLVRTDPDEAEACIERLADVFRYLMRQAEREFVPLADELEIGDAYLDIQRARFRDDLRIEKRIDPRTRSHLIPTLVLQQLTENAVRHGISPKVGGGTVVIETALEDGHLRLRVTDDGVGMDAERLAHVYERGFGLRSIRDRLARLYGPDVGPEITSAPDRGTSVMLRLPLTAGAERRSGAETA